MTTQSNTAARELTITRIINAPRELVFKVWTDAKHVQQWFAPKGFTVPVCQWDAKKDHALYIDMKGPDGVIYPMGGKFLEITEPSKIVFSSGALDPNKKPLFDIVTTITLSAEGNKTKLTMNAVVSNARPEAAPHLAGMEIGWNQTLDKLTDYINQQTN